MKTLIVFLFFLLVADAFAASPAFTGFRGSDAILGTTNPVAGTVTYGGQPYLLTNGNVTPVIFPTSLTLKAPGAGDNFSFNYNLGAGPALEINNSFAALVQLSLNESGVSTFGGGVVMPAITITGGALGAGKVLTDVAGTGVGTWQPPAGGGTPAGSTMQVQWNTNGAFAADPGFYFNSTNDVAATTNGLLTAGFLVQFGATATKLYGQGIHTTNNSDLYFGVNGNSNAAMSSSSSILGSFYPTYAGVQSIGQQTLPWSNLWLTAQMVQSQAFLGGNITATNLDFSQYAKIAMTTNLVVDATYALTNAIGHLEVFLIGQTNGATNHTITFTAPAGTSLSWQDNGTNGTTAFTLGSNTLATVTFDVYTNTLFTNIVAKWKTDSGIPQRMQFLMGAAGGSRSNFVAGGMYYVDKLCAYTNLNSTIGTFTNLATNVIAGLVSTNDWDMYYHRWGLKFRSGFSTNNWQVVLGSETIFDSGVCTNNADSCYIETRIWRTGPTGGHTETTLVLGFSSLTGGSTNRNIEHIQTNGIDTILQLKGASSRFMSFTNNSSYGKYEPVSK